MWILRCLPFEARLSNDCLPQLDLLHAQTSILGRVHYGPSRWLSLGYLVFGMAMCMHAVHRHVGARFLLVLHLMSPRAIRTIRDVNTCSGIGRETEREHKKIQNYLVWIHILLCAQHSAGPYL